ncbi:TPA: hypothetical protein WN373_001102 [Neisseria gonorrhoeae]
MKKNLPALALASMLILSGCDRLGIGNPFSGKEISCGSEETKEILVKLVRDNVEGETVKTFDDDAFKDQAFADIGISHIRRMVERLGITVDEVRTTEKTDTSSKLKCEAALKLDVPDDVVDYAVAANQSIGNSYKKTPDFLNPTTAKKARIMSKLFLTASSRQTTKAKSLPNSVRHTISSIRSASWCLWH